MTNKMPYETFSWQAMRFNTLNVLILQIILKVNRKARRDETFLQIENNKLQSLCMTQ